MTCPSVDAAVSAGPFTHSGCGDVGRPDGEDGLPTDSGRPVSGLAAAPRPTAGPGGSTTE